MSIARRLPTAADTIVVGAGTAGAVVAGRLSAGSSERTRDPEGNEFCVY